MGSEGKEKSSGVTSFLIDFNTFFKVILALFLIYRFNDYRKNPIKFTELDRKIWGNLVTSEFRNYINKFFLRNNK